MVVNPYPWSTQAMHMSAFKRFASKFNVLSSMLVSWLAERWLILIAVNILGDVLHRELPFHYRLWEPLAGRGAPMWLEALTDLPLLMATGLPDPIIATLLLMWVWFVVARRGATWGVEEGWVIRIVRNDGRRAEPWRIVCRHFLSALSFIGMIGYIWVFFDRKGRTLHDILAGTMVMHGDNPPGMW